MLLDTRLHFKDGHHHKDRGKRLQVQNLNLWYGNGKHALKDINLDIYDREVTAFIGPSGCGKSTLLKCLNRINETIAGVRVTGNILLDAHSIYDPDILLMDEPCSALDPNATAKVEELIETLKEKYTIIIITHNLQQAARVSQRAAFFYLGELLESGDTEAIFSSPKTEKCQAFVAGRYG